MSVYKKQFQACYTIPRKGFLAAGIPHYERISGDQYTRLRKAFTLVEILIVIALIIVLSVLTLSGFSRLRQKVLGVSCQSNLRTLSTALHAYIADHNGALIPAATVWATPTSMYSDDRKTGGFWYTQLDPYVNPRIEYTDPGKSEFVYTQTLPSPANKRDVWTPDIRARHAKWQLCPSKNVKLTGAADEYKVVGYGWNYTGFGLTSKIGHASATGTEFAYLSQVEKPGDTIIIGDSKDADSVALPYQNQYLYANKNGIAEGVKVHAERHSGGGNYLFLDGHIEWLTPKQLEDRLPEVFQKIKPH